jgi:single-strand DNA-binding protein
MATRKPRTAPSLKVESSAPPAPESAQTDEQITVTGRLTRDPELRHTPSGLPVTTIRIATNHDDAETTFLSCSVWRKTAEAVCKYKRKGHMVEVTGRLTEGRPWTGRDGIERSEPELVARSVQFVDTRPAGQLAEKEVA